MQKTSRRRLFGLMGAAAALAAVPTTQAAAVTEPTPNDALTLIRAGNAVIVNDADGERIYLSSGDTVIANVKPDQMAPLAALIEASRPAADSYITDVSNRLVNLERWATARPTYPDVIIDQEVGPFDFPPIDAGARVATISDIVPARKG